MDHESNFRPRTTDGADAAASLPTPAPEENSALWPDSGPAPRVSGEGRGQSLEERAERDLEAMLQLLAERAQYLTAASSVTIAIREKNEMICRARAGASAPQLGTCLPLDFGLSGESVRSRQAVLCDDVENDSRSELESYRDLGIRSVIVIPLLREQETIGVCELLADRAHAFEQQDVTAVSRLSEMILTALDHAEAAKRAIKEISAAEPARVASSESQSEVPASVPVLKDEPPAAAPATMAIHRCEACGFPVSEGRTICLDCEEAGRSAENRATGFLSQFTTGDGERSWLESHMYTLATLFIIALTVVLLALKLR